MGGEVTFTVGVIPTRDKESLPALPLLETPQVKGGGVNGYVLERLDIETIGIEDVGIGDMNSLELVLGSASDDLLPVRVRALVALVVIETSESPRTLRAMAYPH